MVWANRYNLRKRVAAGTAGQVWGAPTPAGIATPLRTLLWPSVMVPPCCPAPPASPSPEDSITAWWTGPHVFLRGGCQLPQQRGLTAPSVLAPLCTCLAPAPPLERPTQPRSPPATSTSPSPAQAVSLPGKRPSQCSGTGDSRYLHPQRTATRATRTRPRHHQHFRRRASALLSV